MDPGAPPLALVNRARELMEKAEAEVRRVEAEQTEPPARPFVAGVLNFVFYPDILGLWLGMSLGLMCVLALVDAINQLMTSGAAAVLAAFVAALTGIVGGGVAGLASSRLLTILHVTADGQDHITDWPSTHPTEWMADMFYVVNALAFSYLPAGVLGAVLNWVGLPGWLTVSLTWALFPFVLLSMLETGSRLQPFSVPVYGTLKTCPVAWRTFYLQSSLIAVLVVVIVFATTLLGTWMSRILGSIVLTAGVIVYFRLLGRLAWVCGQTDDLELDATDDEE